jgi:hypothetical protein
MREIATSGPGRKCERGVSADWHLISTGLQAGVCPARPGSAVLTALIIAGQCDVSDKPLKRLSSIPDHNTGLKAGANESQTLVPEAVLRFGQ